MRMTRWDVAGVLGSDYEYRSEDTFRPTMARSRTDPTLDRWYNYDHVGRLHIGRSGSEARAAYGEGWNGLYDGPYSMGVYYDVWGNITLKEGWGGDNPSFTASYTNNRRNGLGYDAAGNLTNDGGQSFSYDATGQQATASYGSLQQSYDGNRLRGKKIDNGATTYYLRSSVLGGQVVAEINSSGSFTRGYVYLGGQLLAVQQNSAVSWVHQDPVTKSQRVTNSAGTVVSTIELDPWGGNTSRNSNDAFQPRKFTTYERDANASDEAMHRRYNRWWSRFDQPDPYDGSYSLSDPQSFNRYAYVQNDPVNFVDPSGLQIRECGTNEFGDPIYCTSTSDSFADRLFAIRSRFGGHNGDRPRGGGPSPGTRDPQEPAKPSHDRTSNDPCAGVRASQLDYNSRGRDGKTGLQHISERHITDQDPNFRDKSKYVFSPFIGVYSDPLAQAQEGVKGFNAATFRQGFRTSSRGNIVFVYAFAHGESRGGGYAIWVGKVGTNPRYGHRGELTNINTLVLGGDCKTVITSHPGLPDNYTDPIGGFPPIYRQP